RPRRRAAAAAAADRGVERAAAPQRAGGGSRRRRLRGVRSAVTSRTGRAGMPILTNTAQQPPEPRRGAVWSIAEPDRELDSNLIRLPAGEEIPAHVGAEVDTLVHVVRGDGTLTTE